MQKFISSNLQVGNPETDDYYDTKGLVEYAWSHAVISDQMYEHINQVCNFKLSNWTGDCIVAMSSVYQEYNKIDIYNIYAPKCNTPQKTSSNVAGVSYLSVQHYQYMAVQHYQYMQTLPMHLIHEMVMYS